MALSLNSGTWLGVLILYTLSTSAAAFSTVRNPLRNCGRQPSSFSFTSSRSSSNDDPISRLPLMEAELSFEADEEKRILLMESINDAKTGAEFGIRSAQFRFYEAFTKQDLEAMKAVWSSADDVRCIHPGMESLNGPQAVLESWGQIFNSGDAFTIEPSRTRVDVSGQSALCSCIEETPGGGLLECLNVYRREEGNWKMILHMASPIAMRRTQPPLA